jgi:hypothetical protein
VYELIGVPVEQIIEEGEVLVVGEPHNEHIGIEIGISHDVADNELVYRL